MESCYSPVTIFFCGRNHQIRLSILDSLNYIFCMIFYTFLNLLIIFFSVIQIISLFRTLHLKPNPYRNLQKIRLQWRYQILSQKLNSLEVQQHPKSPQYRSPQKHLGRLQTSGLILRERKTKVQDKKSQLLPLQRKYDFKSTFS